MANKISTNDFKKLPFQKDDNGNKLYKTPIKDFPEQYYNYNIDKLIEKINELNTIIAKRDAQIETITNTFNSAISNIRAEYVAMLDPGKILDDGNYILKAKKKDGKIEYTWVKEN